MRVMTFAAGMLAASLVSGAAQAAAPLYAMEFFSPTHVSLGLTLTGSLVAPDTGTWAFNVVPLSFHLEIHDTNQIVSWLTPDLITFNDAVLYLGYPSGIGPYVTTHSTPVESHGLYLIDCDYNCIRLEDGLGNALHFETVITSRTLYQSEPGPGPESVPEPLSAGLFALSVLGLAALRRRK